MHQGGKTSGSTQYESWYVATENGARQYVIDALKADIERGRVHEKTLVWRKGMQDWVELGQVPLLRMLVTTNSPWSAQPQPPLPPLATAPASTTAFDELFEDKTTVFNRHATERTTVSAEQDSATDAGSTAIFDGLFGTLPDQGVDSDSDCQSAMCSAADTPQIAKGNAADAPQTAKGNAADAPQLSATAPTPSPRPSNEIKDSIPEETAEEGEHGVSTNEQHVLTESIPNKPEASARDRGRINLSRPPTPRVSIPGVLLATRAEPERVFQVRKPEAVPAPAVPTAAQVVTTPTLEAAPRTAHVARASSRSDAHSPIPPPPPLKPAEVPSRPAAIAPPLPKAAPRIETRLPIPAPPPLLSPMAAPVQDTKRLALEAQDPQCHAKPETQVVSARAGAVALDGARADTPASPRSDSEHPALRVLTALTHADIAKSPSAVASPSNTKNEGVPPRANSPSAVDMIVEPSALAAPRLPANLQSPAPSLCPSSPLETRVSRCTESSATSAGPPIGEPSSTRDPLADSIYPSISSIQPGLLKNGPSKRTLVAFAGITLMAAGVAIVAAVSTGGNKANPASATSSSQKSLRERSTLETTVTATTTDMPVASSTATPETAFPEPSQQRAPQSFPTRASDTGRSSSPNFISVSQNKSSSASGRVTTSKPTPRAKESSPAPHGNKSAANWEQGPVEKRPWMAPGF